MQPPVVPSVSAADVAEDAFLLDVREPAEWQAGHAPAAVHVPLGELPVRLDELPVGREIVCVCRSGGRSGQAAVLLASRGYPVANLDGGMQSWAQLGRAMVSEHAAAPLVL